MLLIENSWKRINFKDIPDINSHNLCFHNLWRSTSIPNEKATHNAFQSVKPNIDPKYPLIILGHESLVWLVPLLKNELVDSIICIIHHGTPTHSLEELGEIFKNKFFEALNYADFLITVSPHLAKILSERFYKNIITVPNFPCLCDCNSNSKLKTLSSEFTILQITTLRLLKRPLDGIELIRELSDIGITAKMTILGNGELYRQITEKIEDNEKIQLIPFATRAQVREMIQSHDFLFLPSDKEGLPRVLGESMQCGTPVIISGDSNHCNIIKHNVNGFIFPTGDIKTAASVMKTISNEDYEFIIQSGYQTGATLQKWRKEALKEMKEIMLHYLGECDNGRISNGKTTRYLTKTTSNC